MFNWLRNLFATVPSEGISPPVPHPDPMGAVRWMEADDPENPFNIRIINCMTSAMGLLSVTEDPKIARSYGRLRNDDGRRHLGTAPPDPLVVDCELLYPPVHHADDGPIYVSREMEHKWDVYLFDGRLYFSRSWTGELVYTAEINFFPDRVTVHRVAGAKDAAFDDPIMAVRQVDFMIKSLLYKEKVPAPLPPKAQVDDTQFLAFHLFSNYGRHAISGSFEDTLTCKLKADPTAPSQPPPADIPTNPDHSAE